MASKWSNRELTRDDFKHEDDKEARMWAGKILKHLGFTVEPNGDSSVIDFKVIAQDNDFSPLEGIEVKTRHKSSDSFRTTVVEADKWQRMQVSRSGLLVFFSDQILFFDYPDLVRGFRGIKTMSAPDENPYTHKADYIDKQFAHFDIACATVVTDWFAFEVNPTPLFVSNNPNKDFKTKSISNG